MPWTEITRKQYERECGRYASDMTDAEWSFLEPLLPVASRLGRPRKLAMREIVNALLYIASAGGAWRLLPKDFPPFSTVQKYFYRWRDERLLEKINHALVFVALEKAGRDAQPTAGVTAGKNMDGFLALLIDLVRANGLGDARIQQKRALLTLPGYFRPTKLWDFLVLHEGRLVAAVELKSHAGPSFGNNFNNRAEEAIGTAHDLWTAYREGAFGKHPKPFVGWLTMVEDAPGSRAPVTERSPNFKVFPEFQGSSYLKRYDLLCQRLMQEQLYSATAVMASKREAVVSGVFETLSPLTSLRSFIAAFAGHVAAEAARERV